MCYIPDYYDNWSEYSRQQEEALEKLPECSVCGERIQDEQCYQINDELICEACMEDFKVYVMDVME